MSEPNDDGLSDLQHLLSAERDFPHAEYDSGRASAWSRIEATTALATGAAAGAHEAPHHVTPATPGSPARLAPTPGHSHAPGAANPAAGPGAVRAVERASATGVAAKLAAVVGMRLPLAALSLVAGSAVGAAGHATFASKPAPEIRVVTHYVERPVPRAMYTEVPALPSASAAPTAPMIPTPSVRASEPKQDGPTRLAAERELIDVARSAVGRHNPDAALRALAEHAKTFPNGALSEEREALWVQALVTAGRNMEARTRADRFRKSYPSSMLLPAVDAAVQGIAP